MSAIEQILKASCGLNSDHPQFIPPPFALVQFLNESKKHQDLKRIQEGKDPFSTMFDLSGNKIIIETSIGDAK